MNKMFLEAVCMDLQLRGYSLTDQRLYVINAISVLREVNEAEDIWMYINERNRISLPAVYSGLNVLIKCGYVMKMKKATCRKYGYKLVH